MCKEWPSYKRSLHFPFWLFTVFGSKNSFNHLIPSSLSVQLFSKTHILPGNSCSDQRALNFVVHFVCCTLPLKIIQGLNTLAFNEIHSTKVAYSRFLSCVDFGLFSLFKTIQRCFPITPIAAPFLFILYVSSGWISCSFTVSWYRSNQ
jgi:hypothetical protein